MNVHLLCILNTAVRNNGRGERIALLYCIKMTNVNRKLCSEDSSPTSHFSTDIVNARIKQMILFSCHRTWLDKNITRSAIYYSDGVGGSLQWP